MECMRSTNIRKKPVRMNEMFFFYFFMFTFEYNVNYRRILNLVYPNIIEEK